MSKESIPKQATGINGSKPVPDDPVDPDVVSQLLDPDDDVDSPVPVPQLHDDPVPVPHLLDPDDPDVEGLEIDGELHSFSCPCVPCRAEYDRIDLALEASRPKTPEEEDERDAAYEVYRLHCEAVVMELEVREALSGWNRAVWREEAIEEWEKLGYDIPKSLASSGRSPLTEHDDWIRARRKRREADALDLDALRHTLPLVAGDTTPVRALLTRSDGAVLLYESRLNSIFGEPSGGKTFVAIMAVIEAVRNGARVVYWDFDDYPSTLAGRLTALGADDVIQGGHLLYATPDMAGDEMEMRTMCDWMERGRRPGLVVIDSVETAGLSTDSNNAAPWFDAHTSPFLARDIGVLPIDHVAKRREDRPMGAIGSQHKRARISGAGLLLIGTPWTKTQPGKIKLVNHKDRLGDLPEPMNKTVAIVSVTHGWGGRLNYTIDAPKAEENTEDVTGLLLEAIAAEGPDGVRTKKNIRGLLNVGHKKLDPALDDCLNNDWVTTEYDGKANVYTVTPEGQKLLDMGLE